MSVQKQIDRLITQRAAEWFEILRGGVAEDHPEFVRWLGESPRHMAEFMAILALNKELPGAFARAGIDREALLSRVSSRVTQLPAAGRPNAEHRSRRLATLPRMAAAAAILAAAGAAVWLGALHTDRKFATAIGEQRTVPLDDGSVMYLNAHSTARVDFENTSREISLVRGEALFEVARDPQRPFRVRTRDAVVQAIGTRFNVDARQNRTVVSVLEGKVEVSRQSTATPTVSEALNAGEAAEVSRAGKVARRSGAEVANAVAWRERQLVFARTSLEDVAADFNRFHESGRMILEDVNPGSHHYTGTFNADDVASFAELLTREKDLKVERRDGDYIIRALPAPGKGYDSQR